MALGETLRIVGPVLIVSGTVLIAGLGVTMLSEMPSIRLYGRLLACLEEVLEIQRRSEESRAAKA